MSVHRRIRQTPPASGPSSSSLSGCLAATWPAAECSWRVLRATSPKDCPEDDCPEDDCPEESCPHAPKPAPRANPASASAIPAQVVVGDALMAAATNSPVWCKVLPHPRNAAPARCIPPGIACPGRRSAPVPQSTICSDHAGSESESSAPDALRLSV